MLLPSFSEMYEALLNRDTSYEGVFVVGVKSTGIFCRPSCQARKPKAENVEFFDRSAQAIVSGYRPCLRCKPMEALGNPPLWVRNILDEAERREYKKLKDQEIRELGVDPNRMRRWFLAQHGMTFQSYLRCLRIGISLRNSEKNKVVDRAMDSGFESLSGYGQAVKKMTGKSPSAHASKDFLKVDRWLGPLGPMTIASFQDKICLLEFSDRRMLETELQDLCKRFSTQVLLEESPVGLECKTQLQEYFDGKRKVFDLPLAAPGSPFNQKVWQGLQNIPYGETRSYQKQAIELQSPKAVRAVARANGMNRIAIIIPCHRVIGKNGKLVGYGGGLWRKKKLLELEGSI